MIERKQNEGGHTDTPGHTSKWPDKNSLHTKFRHRVNILGVKVILTPLLYSLLLFLLFLFLL
jgi:hypothetical protein